MSSSSSSSSKVWVIGAILNLCGSIGINFGTNLMKLHHVKNDNREKAGNGHRKRERHSRTWLIGFAVFALGNVFNFVSMGFAAQSLLAALGSVQFVSNVVFQWLFLNQAITRLLVGATSLIVVGNVLIVIFASHDDKQFTSAQLMHLYGEQTYLTYMAALAVVLVACQLVYLELNKRAREPAFRQTLWILKLLPLTYALVSAIVGTQSVTLAKSSSVLLRKTFTGKNQFAYFFTYVILGAWGGTMVFWMRRLNSALRKYDGLLIVPVLQVCWTFFSILGGGIYFREFNSFSSTQTVLFVLGVLVVFSGIYVLSTAVVSGADQPVVLVDEGELDKPDMVMLHDDDEEEEAADHAGALMDGKRKKKKTVEATVAELSVRSDGSRSSALSIVIERSGGGSTGVSAVGSSRTAAAGEVSTDKEEDSGSGTIADGDEEDEHERDVLQSTRSASSEERQSLTSGGFVAVGVGDAGDSTRSPPSSRLKRDDGDGDGGEEDEGGDRERRREDEDRGTSAGEDDDEEEDDEDSEEVFFQHSPFLQAMAAVGGALPLIESGTHTPVRRSSQASMLEPPSSSGYRQQRPHNNQPLRLPPLSLSGGKAGGSGRARVSGDEDSSAEPRTAPIRRPASHAHLLDAVLSDSPSAHSSNSEGRRRARRYSSPSGSGGRDSASPLDAGVRGDGDDDDEDEETSLHTPL